MPIKSTMNKRDVVRYHKLLEEGVKIEEISKMLLITASTLKKFTPELTEKSSAKRTASRKALLDQHKVDKKDEKKDESNK